MTTVAPDAVILGIGSLVADPLVPLLLRAGVRAVHGVTRGSQVPPPNVARVSHDAWCDGSWQLPTGAVVISLQPIAAVVPHLQRLQGASRLVALSSTRRFSHAASPDPAERAAAAGLAAAEQALEQATATLALPSTVLRPTLIYDMVRDQNLARMARFISRFGVLPIGAPATGLRQPIHAGDVAAAIVAALMEPAAVGAAFNIAGGETLTYRAMAERVFAFLGRHPRFVPLPTGALTGFAQAAQRMRLPINAVGAAAVFARMNQDLVADTTDTDRVLKLSPRPFRPGRPALSPHDG